MSENEKMDQNQNGDKDAREIIGGSREESGVRNSTTAVIQVILNVVLALVVLGASKGIAKKWIDARKPPEKELAIARALKVQTERAELKDRDIVIYGQGTVRAKSDIKIIPEVSGKTVYVHPQFRNGGVVRQGETLYKIDPSDLEKEQARIEAMLSSAKSDIALADRQRETLNDQMAQAKESWQIGKEEADRIARLLEKGAASEAELNQRLITQKSAEERIEGINSQIELIAPSIDKIKSQMEVTAAQLETVKLNLSRTVYKAPFTGRIALGELEKGQFVAVGQPIATLEEAGAYELPVPLSLSDWQAIAQGKTSESLEVAPIPTTVSWSDNEGKKSSWPGKIVRLGSQLDQRTRQVEAIIEIENGGGEGGLISGMFCEVAFAGPKLENVVAIDRGALRGGDQVYIVKDGKFAIQPVEVWRHEGQELYVTSGLKSGDEIITSVVAEPLPGIPVQTLKWDDEPAEKGAPEGENASPETAAPQAVESQAVLGSEAAPDSATSGK